MRFGVQTAASLVALLLCGCITVNLRPAVQPLHEVPVSGTGRAKLLLIDISGVLSGAARDQLLGEGKPSVVAEITQILKQAERDRHIKGVILRINSPGGTVTASDTLYHELRRYKERAGVPVYAHMLDLGTSGAYYVAQAADRIIAQPTTVTGSIGVIMVRPSVVGLLDKIGVRTEEITSGPHKAMGSPFRPLDDADRALFQSVIDTLYERFVEAVDEGRPAMSRDRIREVADGRIYTAKQAIEMGLIDQIGYLDDSVDALKQAAGVSTARVITYTAPGRHKGSLYAAPLLTVDLNFDDVARPGFHYLWRP